MYPRRNVSLERHSIDEIWMVVFLLALLIIFAVYVYLVVSFLIYKSKKDQQYWVSSKGFLI